MSQLKVRRLTQDEVTWGTSQLEQLGFEVADIREIRGAKMECSRSRIRVKQAFRTCQRRRSGEKAFVRSKFRWNTCQTEEKISGVSAQVRRTMYPSGENRRANDRLRVR